MKVTALGVNSAFAVGRNVLSADGKTNLYEPRFQSNFLLEFDIGKDKPYRFVIDFGGDIRHSLLYSADLKLSDIDAWYCSHPHSDHIGGIEGIALSTFFNPFYKKGKLDWIKTVVGDVPESDKNIIQASVMGKKLPDEFKPELFGHKDVLKELWIASAPGLKTLQGVKKVTLQTFFHVVRMVSNVDKKIKDGDREWTFFTIESTHVMSGTSSMPCYGLMFKSSDGKNIYFPTDTMFMMPPTMKSFYDIANVVYQDCETGPKSGVHSHIDDIRLAPAHIKKKLYLYHFNERPETEPGEYKAVLKTGDTQEY
ncbi:MAG: MBL fold metallo-hydrolase [Spirochaetota bacterium]